VTGNLRLAGGGVVSLEAAWSLPDDYPTDIDARLRLVGDHGEVRIDVHDFGMSSFSNTLTYPVPATGAVYGAPQGMLFEELNAFLRAVRGEIAVPVTMREAADAVRVATTIDNAILSGATEQVTYSR
jgi:predicted dehydrogenase